MSPNAERLYALMPAVYRERDAAQGYPLRALVSLIAEQILVLEDDIDQLYDDLFIESCADWAVPYLGALVGISDAAASRAEVANTLAYRRRKGTATVLEQLARDITAWPTSVIEYFQRLATTQYLNHLRPAHVTQVDIRRPRLLGTVFEQLPRSVEVRRIENRRGRYNIANIGVHSWRIPAFEVNDAPAQQVDARRFRFDAAGRDIALFNRPAAETEISFRAEPWNVPMPLSRELLADHPARYFGTSLSVAVGGVEVTPAAEQTWLDVFAVCNLMDFDGGWANMPTNRIAIDPELGRLAFPADAPPPADVQVGYHYGFSARLGGGNYPRQAGFSAGPEVRVPEQHVTLQAAIDAAQVLLLDDAVDGAVVEITDNAVYTETLMFTVAAGKWLELRSAETRRAVLAPAAACVLGGGAGSEVRLDGLLIAGAGLSVPASVDGEVNQLQRLVVSHCTLAPAVTVFDAGPATPIRLRVESRCEVAMRRCISGPLRLAERADLTLSDCIVDAADPAALAVAQDNDGPAGVIDMTRTTVRGRTHALGLNAVDSILDAAPQVAPPRIAVRIERVQQGCLRFCWVPPGSLTPRRYRCVPSDEDARSGPVYTQRLWGDAGYMQLASRCPLVIREGAEDGGEMGAFAHLQQVQKSARLRRNLPEYLRLSLETGLFFES